MVAIKLTDKNSEITLTRVSLEEIRNASKLAVYLIRANGIYHVSFKGECVSIPEAQLCSIIDGELTNCIGTFLSEEVAISQDTILGIKNRSGGTVVFRVVEDNEQTTVLFLSNSPPTAARAAFQLPHQQF